MGKSSTGPPRHRSQYLVNESPIPLYPSLAVALDGSDPALILQQLNYWLTRSEQHRDGRYWVYNTYAEWHEQFPWISVSTIRRVLVALEERGLVVTANYNKQKTDRTKWYSIDDAAVGRLLDAASPAKMNDASAQNEQWGVQDEQMQDAKMDRSVPETTQETTKDEDDDELIRRVARRYSIPSHTAKRLAGGCLDGDGSLRRAAFEEVAYKNRGLR